MSTGVTQAATLGHYGFHIAAVCLCGTLQFWALFFAWRLSPATVERVLTLEGESALSALQFYLLASKHPILFLRSPFSPSLSLLCVRKVGSSLSSASGFGKCHILPFLFLSWVPLGLLWAFSADGFV